MIESIASGSSGNCHVVDNEILLDCGIHIDKIRKYVDLTGLSGCLASHEHMDHVSAVEDLLEASVEVYMDRNTKQAMGLEHHRLHVIHPIVKTYETGNYKVKGFPLVHDSDGGTGFLLKGNGKKIAYITDTRLVDNSFKNLTHLLIEANYSWRILRKKVKEGVTSHAKKTRVIENHLSLEDVERLLNNIDKSKLREVRLLHLSNDNSNREEFKFVIEANYGIPVVVPERRSE